MQVEVNVLQVAMDIMVSCIMWCKVVNVSGQSLRFLSITSRAISDLVWFNPFPSVPVKLFRKLDDELLSRRLIDES